jgi:RNA polymerase sigma-70 factor, ECF subfamily
VSGDPAESAAQDVELVRRFLQGDQSAFAEIVRRHERSVYNLAFRMLGRAEDARDAAQEAFLSCFRHLHKFRGDSTFSTWLHRITVNACYDVLRRRPPTASLDEVLTDPSPTPDHADRVEQAADVQRALMAIPADFRAVLVMFEVQDMTLEEVAQALEIPVGTVKSRLHRGRATLGRILVGGRAGEPEEAVAPSNPPSP